MTIDADKNIRKLARRIIEDAGLPYTEAQLKEIPAILAAKSRYFWCIDNPVSYTHLTLPTICSV